MSVLDDPSNHMPIKEKTTSPFDAFVTERVDPLIQKEGNVTINDKKPYLDKFVGLKKQ